MYLTDDDKRMRDGAEGDAAAAAMDLLIRYGYALDAERLCSIRNVAGMSSGRISIKSSTSAGTEITPPFFVLYTFRSRLFSISATSFRNCARGILAPCKYSR